MARTYRINSSELLGFFILYSPISMALFFFTSGGWQAYIGVLAHTFLYVGCFLILLVKTVWLRYRGKAVVLLPFWLLQSTAVIQFFLYLFNFGDCGDAGGSVIFLQRILRGASWGEGCYGKESGFFVPVVPGYIVYYIFILMLMLISEGTQERRRSQSPAASTRESDINI